jgi:hypothetical protein
VDRKEQEPVTVNDVFALLVVMTALRVFLPDLRAATRRLLRAAARVGVAELLQTRPRRLTDPVPPTPAGPRDAEAQPR